jgi:uncharacterized Tic20 family protein
MSNPTKSSVNWGLVCHVSGLSTYVGLPIVGPLLIWLAKRKTEPVVNTEGREALNFNISFTLYAFVAGLLCILLVGYMLLSLIGMAHLSLIIWAALKANKGESVHYPFTLRFIK